MEYAIITVFSMLFLLGIIIGSFLLYLIPTLIAWYNKSPNAIWIFLINLFLGLTTVGWIVAFLWAIYDAGAFDQFKRNGG